MTSEQKLELFVKLLNLVLVPLVGMVLTMLASFLKSKMKSETQTREMRMVENAFYNVGKAVDESVRCVADTFVKELRDEKGKLSPENQRKAFEKAKEMALATVHKESYDIVSKSIDDMNEWIKGEIENRVTQIKQEVR